MISVAIVIVLRLVNVIAKPKDEYRSMQINTHGANTYNVFNIIESLQIFINDENRNNFIIFWHI